MHRGRAAAVHAGPVLGARVGQEKPVPAPVWKDDLARVQMAGENQVPASVLDAVEHPWEMAEQQPERCLGRPEAARTLFDPRARVDPRDLDAQVTHPSLDGLV